MRSYERDPSLRLSLLQRTKAMLIEHGVGFHLVFYLVLFASLWLSVKESMWRSGAKEEVWLDLVAHALYPGLPWQSYLAFLTPITYTLWPPSMPDRRSLLELDERTGVLRPRAEHKVEHWNRWIWLHAIWPFMSIFWMAYLYLSL